MIECNEKLLPALRKLVESRPSAMRFRGDFERFGMCLRLLENGNESEGLFRETRKIMQEIPQNIREFLAAFGDAMYPFEHLEQEMTIAKFLCSSVPGTDNPGEVYEAANSIIVGYYQLYRRIIARLCQMAASVEEHFGLPMLPVPKTEDAEE